LSRLSSVGAVGHGSRVLRTRMANGDSKVGQQALWMSGLRIMEIDATTIGVFLTAGGLIAVAFQIRDTRRLAKAQFVSNLENDLTSHYSTYGKLLPGETWSNNCTGPRTKGELAEIIPYLSFFAKLKFLLDLGAVDLALINRMFSFRFFLAVHNEHVQHQIIFSDLYYPYWAEIIVLHSQWLVYRRENRLAIPFEEANPAVRYSEKYQEILNDWKASSLREIE
jgi:hypothetical protein